MKLHINRVKADFRDNSEIEIDTSAIEKSFSKSAVRLKSWNMAEEELEIQLNLAYTLRLLGLFMITRI